MTERIYYTDPYRTEFDARIMRVFDRDGRTAIILDRTAFYPTSGGQPHDVGTLGEVDVVEVVDDGDEIVHIVPGPPATGGHVRGVVDWARRFDHMQQHTGQHILSAAFDRLFDNRTMSFHMGAEVSTIDLQSEMDWTQIDRALDTANHVVFEDRPVSIRFATPEEAAALPLRKEPVREGPLRLIDVTDFDLSACGGTHVARTGAVGLIAAIGAERFRGGTRLAFACGRRALRAFNVNRQAVAGVVRQLSVLPHELPPAVERLQAETKELRKMSARLQEALALYEAERLLPRAHVIGATRVVAASLDGWDLQGLKWIASALTAHAGIAVLLVSSAPPLSVVVGRSADVKVDAGKILRELAATFGGRGGGKPELAQGGGFAADPATLITAGRELMATALGRS